jgi:DNA helicase-2/ATP-dependent DNA helicase PcrA
MNTQTFDQKYKSLNPAQKKAVDAIDGPVMVIAGPGTGKTTILTLRIANILKRTDTPPSGILAITYTDAGVKAMRAKLREIIGNRAHEIAIHTFHSFAAAMIAEYPDHFLHLDGMAHMSDVEQESLIRSIISKPEFRELRPTGKPDAYISAIMRAIDNAKREAQTPEMVRKFAEKETERIKKDDDSISTRGITKGKLKAEAQERIEKCGRTVLFSQIYEKYEKDKREQKKMDFNDLLIELLVALRNDELFLRLIQERFLYLLVDEHQDTNDAQNFIVATIAEFFETPNIFIVGDEKQAIYRFQGASVENFLTLQKRWPTMQVISLDTNYRSHQGILDASFAMIENNYEGDEHKDLRVRLTAGDKGKQRSKAMPADRQEEKRKDGEGLRKLDVVTGENVSAIERYLVVGLETILKEEPTATVAVITRRNRDLERIIRLLESNHIPVSSERSVDIFHHSVGALFFDLMEFLADYTRTDCLAKTIAAGMWGISIDEAIPLIKSLRSGQFQGLPLENQSKGSPWINKIPSLVRLQRKMQEDSAVAFLIHAAESSGFSTIASRDPAAIHVWRGIIALAESLAREGNIQSPLDLIKAMLVYRQSAESKTVKVSVGAPDLSISAMTAHGSKGLEFDYVFMPYATEEAWIGRTRGASFVLPEKSASGNDIRDTRRLFYVALTRAKKHAVILTALEESDGKSLTPLRFIAELDPKSVAAASLPRFEAELPRSDLGQIKVRDPISNKMTAIAKQVLLENGLSVTALNHFLECPNKFLYLSILKLPQAPSPAAEKGTAMHYAISSIWKEGDRTASHIQDVILEKAAEYLDTSFLAAEEKESVKKDLFEDAPAVAKALESHFAVGRQAAIFTERWVKTVFDTTPRATLGQNGSPRTTMVSLDLVEIPLHGKLDAIIDAGNEIQVFDYKTREGMSVNEIKGETKNSTGDYFRQLVFYRILLDDEPRWRGKKITPALVFISPDKKGRCPIVSLPIAHEDIEKVKEQIQSVIDSVWSGGLVSSRCDDPDCEWCGLAKVSFD